MHNFEGMLRDLRDCYHVGLYADHLVCIHRAFQYEFVGKPQVTIVEAYELLLS